MAFSEAERARIASGFYNLRAMAQSGQEAFAAGMKAEAETGPAIHALRTMIAEVREALSEMDDLADADLPRAAVAMRDGCRLAIAKARKVLS